ncbi:hypothetical protein Scep_003598 [Stephania cephalantha]|uniref:RING-type domain-containing protein n=1 Tax=Stephania cephalantha TaxID=152367 RepID=A0AAP0KSE9_9MAGN
MTQQMEFHYINTGFPYTVTESFMSFFDGLTYNLSDFSFPSLMPDQESAYWPMPTVSNKFGLSGVGNISYHEYSYAYGLNSHVTRTVEERRSFDNSSLVNHEDWDIPNIERGETSSTISQTVPEECIRSHDNGGNSQVIWQDDIDPDNMTYEELLDLGEAVGTQSRGLSPEMISSLPISKYKHGSFFSRKKSRERCVICQMEYKRRDRQMTLPCKHVYHASCGSRWLSINKACPVCYAEVTGEESKH